MDSLGFVRDGGNNLPPGFRFEPTDEEIVFQYLARKTFNHPLPAQVIPEINIFSFDPWELPGNPEQDNKYFFSYKNESQSGKATCCGYWKAVGSTKRIICSKSSMMPILGIRRSLVFYKAGTKNTPRASRTDWIMHEYCVALSEISASSNNTHDPTNISQGCLVRIGNWTLCRVFLKKSRSSKQVDHDHNDDHNNRDFTSHDDVTYSSSASSSAASPYCDSTTYTDVSSSIDNGEEDTSYLASRYV